MSVPNFSFLACLEVARLVRLARLARSARLANFSFLACLEVAEKFMVVSGLVGGGSLGYYV